MRKSSDNSKQNLKRLAIGGMVAATAGYVAGILTAPKSGKETRKDIKATADRGMAQAEKELKKLHTQLDKTMAQAKVQADKAGTKAKKELNELLAKAKKTKEKVREVISAVHEGDADDKDLKKAVDDANAAITSLKKYLKR